MEIWKDIPGYEGAYQVSNLGRVRSLERIRVVNNCHGGRSERRLGGGIMSPNKNGNGYLCIILRDDGVKDRRYIHRLVAEAFCDNPEKLPEVNHLDHDRANNRADNLEWCSRAYNVNYSAELMRKPKSRFRESNTGIKYVSRREKNGRASYVVNIRPLGISRRFKTLAEARAFIEGVVA